MTDAEPHIITPIVALVGPTAIGKTALSLQLARDFNCEIVSVDSMQVYRHMDIGTAKIRPEEMQGIPHHLIDIVNPDEEYDAARFVSDATRAIRIIGEKGKLPLLTGGTGLYLKALTEGLFTVLPENKEVRKELQERVESEGSSKLHEELADCDPESASRIHPNDSMRIIRGLEIFTCSGIPWSTHLRRQKEEEGRGAFDALQIALTCNRERLYERINHRSRLMLEEGLEAEVENLLNLGYGRDLHPMNAIGYRHMLQYLDKVCSYDEMLELLQRDTRRYAKRQYTWFRGIRGIEWFEVADTESINKRIDDWLNIN
ncbi:tRNA (adenosine(37)-N6)-dimethylallyltransferase MiaA [Desulfopila aestuarii]|uniref:tRNA dimethylallyltransferase n=1 Tax=Desulfopila aestuarii DSM 18488 TaxID=1121416 RepID=A0A1M7Y0W7_9BACT|nr:tRNA (adenosine(37)-N6)-dimethylallyltransferase MiaA [Desulfopila aestuarii]SHO45356.1 tRNA dimethylallyltransferase [Desulfopila aestuarii DSM 18488]